MCIPFNIRGQRTIVLSGFKMNPLTNAFRCKDLVKQFFLLGEFNILLGEKPCPWSPRWQIMGLILLVSQIRIPHKCTAPLFFSRITLKSRSDAVTSNFSTDINHLWIRPPEDEGRSIWIWLFICILTPHWLSMKKRRLGTCCHKPSTLHRRSETSWEVGKTGVEQLKHCGVHQIQSHSQLNDTKWVWEETLVKLVQDFLFLTYVFSSWTWLPQNITDLKHWSGSTSNTWMFLSKTNNLELCVFFLPKIKLVLGFISPRSATEKTSASST